MIPLTIVETIGSTSDALKQLAEVGADEQALMARAQTSGRGRLGRVWQAPAGNLSLSVLLRPGSLRWPGHWSLLAGVAVAETVAAWTGSGPVALKWPNDVLLDGGKVAGVLVEVGVDVAAWLVVGIGVNLATAPEGVGRAVAAVADFAPAPDAEVFARRLLDRLAAWRVRYEVAGFDSVREAWLGWGPALGAVMRVGTVAGSFAGLAESGALLVDTGSGLATVVAGETE